MDSMGSLCQLFRSDEERIESLNDARNQYLSFPRTYFQLLFTLLRRLIQSFSAVKLHYEITSVLFYFILKFKVAETRSLFFFFYHRLRFRETRFV